MLGSSLSKCFSLHWKWRYVCFAGETKHLGFTVPVAVTETHWMRSWMPKESCRGVYSPGWWGSSKASFLMPGFCFCGWLFNPVPGSGCSWNATSLRGVKGVGRELKDELAAWDETPDLETLIALITCHYSHLRERIRLVVLALTRWCLSRVAFFVVSPATIPSPPPSVVSMSPWS